MSKKLFLTLVAAMSLGTAGMLTQQPQPIYAQSVYQKIPKSYRGTWHYHGKAIRGSRKLVVRARSIHGSVVGYKGKSLGVHKGKHFVAVFQIAKGKQVGENFVMHRTRHNGKAALRISYDTANVYYTK